MEYVKIVVTLYDDAGTIVGTDFTYTELDVIPPGDKSPFHPGLRSGKVPRTTSSRPKVAKDRCPARI